MVVQSVLTVLATIVVAFPLQSGRGVHEPRDLTLTCSAHGASCLFGDAGGCTVTCKSPLCAHCMDARCVFGFPVPSLCECTRC